MTPRKSPRLRNDGEPDMRYGVYAGPSRIGRYQTRPPVGARVPVVRELFEKADEMRVTLKTLARRTGYHPVQLSQWRHGQRISPDQLTDLANALGYDIVLRPVSVSAIDETNNLDK